MLSSRKEKKLKNNIKPAKMFNIFFNFPYLELLCSVNTTPKPKKGLRCQMGVMKYLLKYYVEKLDIFK